jgi:hypothetical protein
MIQRLDSKDVAGLGVDAEAPPRVFRQPEPNSWKCVWGQLEERSKARPRGIVFYDVENKGIGWHNA